MPRRKRERKHTASAHLAVPSLTKAGSSLWLTLAAEGKRIGKLEIGRGAIYWSGRGRWRTKRKRISWSRFAEIMDEFAYG